MAELPELPELPEQPARDIAPASITLPIMRPARAPCRGCPVRLWTWAELALFSMPL